MFLITEDPSPGSLVQRLAKNYKNDSIASVDMDKVVVMVICSDPLCVCVHTAITPTISMSTDTIDSFLQFLTKHCTSSTSTSSATNGRGSQGRWG